MLYLSICLFLVGAEMVSFGAPRMFDRPPAASCSSVSPKPDSVASLHAAMDVAVPLPDAKRVDHRGARARAEAERRRVMTAMLREGL